MIYSMFIDPPLARVGMNEAQARKSGRNVLTARMPMSRIARAREKDETRGLVKFLVNAHSSNVRYSFTRPSANSCRGCLRT